MKAREIILLILIVAAGVFFYHAYTGKLNIDIYWDEDFFFFFEPFEFDETFEMEPPFPAEIHVVNRNGEVEILGTDDNKISIRLTKKIWRRDEEDAREVANTLKLITEKDGMKILFRTNREELRRRRFNTYFTVHVPKGMDIKVKNTYGQVKISNTGNTEIDNPNGTTIVTDVTGTLRLTNKYEDVEITNVDSDCFVDSNNSEVCISNVGGDAEIIHRYGRVEVEDVVNNVVVDGSNSDISCKKVGGSVEAESSYAEVYLRDVGPAKVRCSNCDIEIDGVRDICDIVNKYGRVEVTNLEGDLKIDGKNMSVFGRSITGNSIFVSTTYRDIALEEFTGKTEIIHSNGNIFLTPSPLTSPLEVTGHYSDINLYWPEGGRYPIEAQNKGGDIQWELPEQLSYEKENSVTVIKAFETETLNPRIFLSTKYGTIRIEKLVSE
jgi:hypothetical protein